MAAVEETVIDGVRVHESQIVPQGTFFGRLGGELRFGLIGPETWANFDEVALNPADYADLLRYTGRTGG